jgi:hypothetical protein
MKSLKFIQKSRHIVGCQIEWWDDIGVALGAT